MNASKIDQSAIVFASSPDVRLLDSPAIRTGLGAAITTLVSQRLAEEVIARFETERRFPDLSLTVVQRSTLTVQERLTLDRQLKRLTDIAGGLGSDDYHTSSASAARLGSLQMYLDNLADELGPLVREHDAFLQMSLFRSGHLASHLDDAKACTARVRQLRRQVRAMRSYLDRQERSGCDIYGFNYHVGDDPTWDRMEAEHDSLRDEVFAGLPALCSSARCFDNDLTYCRKALAIETMSLADREQRLWLMEEELCTLVASLEGHLHHASRSSSARLDRAALDGPADQQDAHLPDGFAEPDQLTLKGKTYVLSPPDGLVGAAVRRVVAHSQLRMSDLFRGGRASIWEEDLHDPPSPHRRRQVQKVRQLFDRLEKTLLSAEPPLNIGFKVTKTHIERTIHLSDDRV